MVHKNKQKFHIPFIIISLIAAISLAVNFFLVKERKNYNQVTEVVDGDTFQLKSGKRVRLMGIDAPEFDRCGGSQAKDRLTELIMGKNVILKEETEKAFGRSLSLVYYGGSFINKIMLEEGWGRTDYRKNTQRDVLTSAFHEAQVNKAGIFSPLCRLTGERPKGDCLIKGNIGQATYEKFYHLPGCRHYDEVVLDMDRGEVYFCTEEEAQSFGFRKASSCP